MLAAAGVEVREDEPLEGYDRVYVDDPFGNRLELLERPELAAVAAASHEAGQRDLPFVVVGAGLPGLPVSLTEAKSYAERLFEYRRIGPLGTEDARAALIRPSEALGVGWIAAASDLVLDVSAGYPYFIQVFGNATWDFAEGPPVDEDDARVGIEAGVAELDIGFYGSRWERATTAQRAYLVAIAEDGAEAASSAEVARRLGRRPSGVSAIRDQLIKKGLLHAPDRGTIAFTVPGLAEYIHRHSG